MKKKIADAIKSFYQNRFDEYVMSPEEVADLVIKCIVKELRELKNKPCPEFDASMLSYNFAINDVIQMMQEE